jgi:uncharacterized protein (DUF433 family)
VDKAIEQGVIEVRTGARGARAIPVAEVAALSLLHQLIVKLSPREKRRLRDWISSQPPARLRRRREYELSPWLLVRSDPVVGERLGRAMAYARLRSKLILSDPETKGGEPVIRGTRLTTAAVAARLDGGDSIESLRKDYPYVDPRAFEVAAVYARTHPRRGRPPRPWREQGREVTHR